jgi:SAM-dependent methyltransferase
MGVHAAGWTWLMSAQADGYITDLGYTHGYYRELSPLRVKLALLKAGLPAPDFTTACELGFGQGVSLAIHAAASSTFWHGNDLNPEHVASANALVKAADVRASLHQETFAEFAGRSDLPDFDYVVLNGVWSWVSEENRRRIVDFVRRRLKVGGVFFASYNTLPGWGPFLSLRELLVGRANRSENSALPIIERIDDALDFASRLIETIPAVAQVHPKIAEQLAKIRGQNRRYVAHEFFNEFFCPMHFPTVAAALAPAGLSYAASAAIGELPSVFLERSQLALLRTIGDPVYRELAHDVLVNRSSRRDYWIKGPVSRLEDDERAALLRRLRIVAAKPHPELPAKLRAVLALNRSGLPEGVYWPILERLARLEPVSLETIEQQLAPTGAHLEQILDAVLLIAAQNQLELVQDEETVLKAAGHTSRLNDHLLGLVASGGELEHLASPVTGTGIRVGRLQQLFLLAMKRGLTEPDAWAELARQASPADGGAVQLVDQARSFADNELPLLRALRIG